MQIKTEILKTFVPMDSLSSLNLTRLAQQTKLEKLSAGAILFERGDNDRKNIFLLSGQVELDNTGVNKRLVTADTEQARYALSNLKPRQYTSEAITDVRYVSIDSDFLDKLLIWEQVAWQSRQGMEVSEIQSHQTTNWMHHLLKTKTFLRLPTSSIDGLFRSIEEIKVNAGDQLVRQGDPGDYYYIIQAGQCRISRTADNGEEIALAELDEGECFGEEALISDQPRNANATMITDGVLMRLSREDFKKLLQAPLIKSLTSKETGVLRKKGALLVDVRLEEEHKNDGRIKGSINLPLYDLRLESESMDREKTYIFYCDTGARSSAAAFLLTERGFNAYFLEGGLLALIGNKTS